MDDFATFLCVCGLPLFSLCTVGLLIFISQERADRKRLETAASLLEGRLARAEWHVGQLTQRLVVLEASRLAPAVEEEPPPPIAEAFSEHAPEPPASPVVVPVTQIPTVDIVRPVAAFSVSMSPSTPYAAAEMPAEVVTTPEVEDSKLDLEQWLGLRGAAVAGALVLIAAGAAFFQYSVEHGLVGPAQRVIIGALVGLGLIAGGEATFARPYAKLARLLQGAGASIAYFAAWSASARYGLVPPWTSMLSMVVITIVTCLLSARHHSLATAILGLAGGFATPALLSTGTDRPIALFAYLGVLDFGLLYLSRRRKWGGLALFALAVTLLYEAVWVTERMRVDRIPLGMLVVTAIAALFAVSASSRDEDEDGAEPRTFGLARIIAALSPFVFALHTSLAGVVLEHALMTAALLVLLHGGTLWLARREKSPFIAVAGAGAISAVSLVAIGHTVSASTTAWPFVAAFAIATLVHGIVSHEDDGIELLSATMLLTATIRGAVGHRDALPIVVVLVAISVFSLARSAARKSRPTSGYLLAAGSAVAIAVTVFAQRHVVDAIPENALPLACDVLAITLAVLATRAPESLGKHPRHAAALGIAILIVSLTPWAATDCVTAVGTSATCIALTVIGLVVARDVPGWPIALVIAVTFPLVASISHPPERALFDILRGVLLFGSAAFMNAWTRLSSRADANASARFASSIAPFAVFAPLAAIAKAHFGEHGVSVVALALTIAPLLVSAPLSSRPYDSHFAAAIALLSIGVVLELDDNAVVAALLVLATAVAYVFHRTERGRLLLLSFVLACAAISRAIFCAISPTFGRGYPFLSPITLGFAGGAVLLFVLASLVESAKGDHGETQRHVAVGSRLAALALLFVFVTLVFRDAFGNERNIAMPFDRALLISVSTSLGYAVYAMVLVGVGMRRDHRNLRATGLALFALTSFKIFLVDLGNQRDLYRVASLLGLAISLLLVSVAYQRFVLRRPSITPRAP